MRILLALDGAPNGESAAPAIAAWAREPGARVALVSVLHPREVHATHAGGRFAGVPSRGGAPAGPILHGVPPAETTALAEDRSQALARARSEREDYLRHVAAQWFAGADVTIEVVDGEDTASAIVAAAVAGNAEIIALATRGRAAFGQALLGAVHEDVVRRAPMPVLLVGPAVESAPSAG